MSKQKDNYRHVKAWRLRNPEKKREYDRNYLMRKKADELRRRPKTYMCFNRKDDMRVLLNRWYDTVIKPSPYVE